MLFRSIKDYLSARYSDFILYRPEVNKTTWLLWGAPVLFMLLGAGTAYSLYRKNNHVSRSIVAINSSEPIVKPDNSDADGNALSSSDQQRLAQLLADGEEPQ